MPVNQYGLPTTDENNPLGTSSTSPTPGNNSQGAQQESGSPFGGVASNQVNAAGAAPVAPPITNFAYNEKYAAQNQVLEQLLADKQREKQNQLFASQESFDRNVGEAGRTRDKALEALINKYASSGMIGSGIDARSRGDLETDYNRYLGDLRLALTNTQNSIEGSYADVIRNVNTQRAGMWAQQRADEEAARQLAEQRRLDAEKAQREAENQARIAAEYRAAQEAAARQPPAVINMGGVTGNTVTGGGGGGGAGAAGTLGSSGAAGWQSNEARQAGIGPGDSMIDIQNQIQALINAKGIHQLSVLYSAPELNNPALEPLKIGLRNLISQASTPGHPLYMPQDYNTPGGFY
jgi:hypothetical protein